MAAEPVGPEHPPEAGRGPCPVIGTDRSGERREAPHPRFLDGGMASQRGPKEGGFHPTSLVWGTATPSSPVQVPRHRHGDGAASSGFNALVIAARVTPRWRASAALLLTWPESSTACSCRACSNAERLRRAAGGRTAARTREDRDTDSGKNTDHRMRGVTNGSEPES